MITLSDQLYRFFSLANPNIYIYIYIYIFFFFKTTIAIINRCDIFSKCDGVLFMLRKRTTLQKALRRKSAWAFSSPFDLALVIYSVFLYLLLF